MLSQPLTDGDIFLEGDAQRVQPMPFSMREIRSETPTRPTSSPYRHRDGVSLGLRGRLGHVCQLGVRRCIGGS